MELTTYSWEEFDSLVADIGKASGIENPHLNFSLSDPWIFDFDTEIIKGPPLDHIINLGSGPLQKVVFVDSRSAFTSSKYTNPTWIDLIVSATWAVQMRYPTDHIWLETLVRNTSLDTDDAYQVYEMYFGS